MISAHSPLSPAKQIAVHACGLAVLLAISLTGYGLAIRPIHGKTAASISERGHLQMLIDSAPDIRKGVAALQQEIQHTEQELDRLLDRVPDRPSLEPLLAAVSAAAQEATAQVLSLQPVAERGSAQAAVQRLRLRLRCDHASLCRFLAALDQHPLPIWVVSVELQGSDIDVTGRGGGIRHADLTLRVPHAAEKMLAGATKRSLSLPPGA